jgi:plasmid stabilization system protein ParE
MHKIKYSNQAEADLQDAIEYIAKESVSMALDYLNGYEDKIELLQLNPFMGIECKTKLIKRDCRVLVYKSHIIIYKINSTAKEILIIRVYHHSEDYINRLK